MAIVSDDASWKMKWKCSNLHINRIMLISKLKFTEILCDKDKIIDLKGSNSVLNIFYKNLYYRNLLEMKLELFIY